MNILKLGSILALTLSTAAFADGDLSRLNVIEVPVELGSNDDGMFIDFSMTDFVTGQAYDLVITNTDEFKHEIALNEFAEVVFTRKIEISDADGNLVAEIKGMIREVEVGAGQTVHWFLVPIQTSEEPFEITCELPGHYESGMHTEITVH
jgi:uncharacterized cupredoxin-like copper-binding protein